jgi:hypothetical protein
MVPPDKPASASGSGKIINEKITSTILMARDFPHDHRLYRDPLPVDLTLPRFPTSPRHRIAIRNTRGSLNVAMARRNRVHAPLSLRRNVVPSPIIIPETKIHGGSLVPSESNINDEEAR